MQRPFRAGVDLIVLTIGFFVAIAVPIVWLGLGGMAAIAADGEGATERQPGQFDEAILKAASEYQNWERVSDRPNWAPTLCRLPPLSGAHISNSKDSETHGRKLYYLFAENPSNYRSINPVVGGGDVNPPVDITQPVGQVLVKQSWMPIEVKRSEVPEFDGISRLVGDDGYRIHPPEYAFDGDRAFKIDKQGPLFIMLKLNPETPDTDQGWVYATLTPDGSEVTAAGKIESCMKCHVESKNDRMIGLWK